MDEFFAKLLYVAYCDAMKEAPIWENLSEAQREAWRKVAAVAFDKAKEELEARQMKL